MSYTVKNIDQRIKKCRKEHGLTQEQLAELIDIAPNYLGQIENGRRGVNITNLIKIANRLNITFDYLLSDSASDAVNAERDISEKWQAILSARSPMERERLYRIVKSLSENIFE